MTEGFRLGDRITVHTRPNDEQVTGVIVEILYPEEGLPGSRRVGGSSTRPFSTYSGGYCREHRRPAPPYEGAPHIAPTLPQYTICTAAGDGIMRCACQVVTESRPVELWEES